MARVGGVIPKFQQNGKEVEVPLGPIDVAAKAATVAGIVAKWGDGIHVNVGGVIEKLIEITINYAFPLPLLNEGEYTEMFMRSQLGDNDYTELMKTAGIDASNVLYDDITLTGKKADGKLTWDAAKVVRKNPLMIGMLRSKVDWPKLAELFDLWNRGLVDDALADAIMRFNGIADAGIRKAIAELRYEIPPMSDLIRWAVRHAFDVDIVEEFKYLDEVPTQLYALADAQGLGGKTGVQYPKGKDNKGGVLPAHEAKWFDMEWVAHWVLPSTGQGYEMLHRLYPQSRFGPSPDSDVNTQFDVDHLKLLLRAQDIPPYWRDRLVAISYSPLSRRDIQGMYENKVLKIPDVYHAYRAMGYNDANAMMLTDYLRLKVDKKDTDRHQKKAEQYVCKAYSIGTLEYQDAINWLVNVGIEKPEAELSVKECVLQRSIKTAEEVVKATKVQVVKGIIDMNEARNVLTRASIVPSMIDYYLQSYQLALTESRKNLSATEINKMYSQGIITKDEAFQRLVTLGYYANDATRMLVLWDADIYLKQQKASQAYVKAQQAKLDKARTQYEKNARQLAATTKASQTAADKAKRDAKTTLRESLVGITTKNLASWYVNGQLTKQQTIAYLQLKNWRQDVIDHWITELDNQIAVGETTKVSAKGSKPATEG